MSEKTTLLSRLQNYADADITPFHMPGHQRKHFAHLDALCSRLDITEIANFDNLHAADGVLKAGMARLARQYGNDRSFFLVNGSTCGILSAVRCATAPGDEVIVARNCHRSVYHALALCGLQPHFLPLPTDPATGLCLSVPPQAVAQALEAHPNARLVILTSPTYDGVISDVEAICQVAHAKEIPVLVDEAHGAHLGFLDPCVRGAVACGADLVIQSFHKTLPSLTQTAVAHLSGDLISPQALEAQLAVFETSSPSYLLMASIEGCADWLAQGKEVFAPWQNALDVMEEAMASFAHVKRFGLHDPRIFAYDKSKIVLYTNKAFSGVCMAQTLRTFGIETEMATARTVLAMTGAGTTENDVVRLCEALADLDKRLCGLADAKTTQRSADTIPHRALSWQEIAALHQKKRKAIPLAHAQGQISADFVFAYPPGIPLIAPGERWDADLIAQIEDLCACGLLDVTQVWVLE